MYVCKDKRIKQTRLNAVQANGNAHELWGDLPARKRNSCCWNKVEIKFRPV